MRSRIGRAGGRAYCRVTNFLKNREAEVNGCDAHITFVIYNKGGIQMQLKLAAKHLTTPTTACLTPERIAVSFSAGDFRGQ